MSDPLLFTPSDCVLYLDLRKPVGDRLFDYSGNGNHGIIHGARLLNQLPLKGLYFDGVDDYVEVSDSLSLRLTDELTILVWIYLYDYPLKDYARVVDKGQMYELAVRRNTGVLSFALNNDVGWVWRDSDDVVPLKQWTQVGLAYDAASGVVRLYMNGVEVHHFNESGTIAADNYRLTIGCYYNGTQINLHGHILLIQIYNRALSSEEIKQCYEDIKERILRRIKGTGLI